MTHLPEGQGLESVEKKKDKYQTVLNRSLFRNKQRFSFVLDQSPAILTLDDSIRSDEIVRTIWPIYLVIGHFVLTI